MTLFDCLQNFESCTCPSQSRVIEESREFVKLMVTLLAIPLICQGPTVMVKVAQCLIPVNPWISRAVMAPFPIPSACSPLVILFMVKRYRQTAWKFVKGKKIEPCDTIVAGVLPKGAIQLQKIK